MLLFITHSLPILHNVYHSHLVATSEGKLNFETLEHLCLLAKGLFTRVFTGETDTRFHCSQAIQMKSAQEFCPLLQVQNFTCPHKMYKCPKFSSLLESEIIHTKIGIFKIIRQCRVYYFSTLALELIVI